MESNSRDEDNAAKAEFLRTGKVPLRYAVFKGIQSLLVDPFRFISDEMPGPLGFKLRQLWYSHAARKLGKGVIIDKGVYIPKIGEISIDDFTYIGWGAEIYAPEGYVHIGKRCHIRGRILGHGGVEIGNYVGMSGTLLSITDSHQGGFRRGGPMIPLEQRNLRRGKVILGDDSTVSQQSIVLPGVTIGEGAVVAPFSLVVRDVPAWTVVSGVPAVKLCDREPVKFPDPD